MTVNYINHDHDDRAKALHSFLVNDGFTKEEMEHIKFKINDDDTSYIDLDGENVNESYMVLTDEEADEKVKEYIEDSAWAFNSSFLAAHSKVDENVFKTLQEQCESSNEAVLSLIDDFDHFVDDAILSDGRGHFLASYDGAEEEYSNYFIYRC
tara:strand:- start:29 stop:487 length:459 start_codon:yes stop_codon:yes gene_type:complete